MWSECMRRVDCGGESVDVKDGRKEMGTSSLCSLQDATKNGGLGG